MSEFNKKYFLAANSGEGFYSKFKENYDCFDGWQAFIIKGGPGTGKSSLMKKVAAKAEYNGYDTILCPCSSDPDSLDAVILPDKKIIILDGTAPHVVEPSFPGACENIINLGDCWDKTALYKNRNKIIDATLKNKLIHKTVSRYLLAAGQIFNDNIKLSEPYADNKHITDFATRLCKKTIPQKSAFIGTEWVRFIEGVTPKGIVCFSDTITDNYKHKIIFEDDYAVTAPLIMEIIRKYALAAGYEVITLKNPFLPSLIIDHILIPELSMAFLTENSYIRFECDERRIHSRRFLDVAAINRCRQKRRFNKKIFDELISTACLFLAQAKKTHDELESYYISSMDFGKTEIYVEKIWDTIINNS